MLAGVAAVMLALLAVGSATTATAAGKYGTQAYIAVSRSGAAVYVNALVKQGYSSPSIIRSHSRTVYVQRSVNGTWQTLLQRTTDANGQFTVGFVQAADYTYRLYVSESGSALAAFSATAKSVTPPKAATQAYVSGSRSGTATYINAMVKQGAGASVVRSANRTVYVQRLSGSTWVNISSKTTNTEGQFTLGFVQPASAIYRLYVAASATASAASSGTVTVGAYSAPPSTSRPPAPTVDYDCGDFATKAQAQAVFNQYYPSYGDVFRLDADNDRIACETLP